MIRDFKRELHPRPNMENGVATEISFELLANLFANAQAESVSGGIKPLGGIIIRSVKRLKNLLNFILRYADAIIKHAHF